MPVRVNNTKSFQFSGFKGYRIRGKYFDPLEDHRLYVNLPNLERLEREYKQSNQRGAVIDGWIEEKKALFEVEEEFLLSHYPTLIQLTYRAMSGKQSEDNNIPEDTLDEEGRIFTDSLDNFLVPLRECIAITVGLKENHPLYNRKDFTIAYLLAQGLLTEVGCMGESSGNSYQEELQRISNGYKGPLNASSEEIIKRKLSYRIIMDELINNLLPKIKISGS